MRYLFLISLSFCFFHIANAQIDCPPDTVVECYQVDNLFENIVIEANKTELIPEKLSGDDGCEPYSITIGYFLYDVEEDERETTPTCVRNVLIKSFDPEDIVWPDTLVYLSDFTKLSDIQYTAAGLFPKLENTCNLIYVYEDQFVNTPIQQRVIRTWTALDWCTAQTHSFTQVIKEELTQVNGLYTRITNCGGTELKLEDYEIRINDLVVDGNPCNAVTLYELLNCIALDNNLSSNDKLSLTFTTDYTALSGVSTIDLVKIQRHILGLEKFSEPCSTWAADVNDDNRINGRDLVEIRKLILGISTELPSDNTEVFLEEGRMAGELIFTGDDFPLTELELTHTNKGNVGN